MEIKLFGKSLFKFKTSKSEALWGYANNEIKESKYLPDFYIDSDDSDVLSEYVMIAEPNGAAIAVPKSKIKMKGKKSAKKKGKFDTPISITLTPKGVYEMKLLNDESFVLNTNPEYVDKQLEDFKDKLGIVKSEEYDMRNGVREISSVITRLENRKKYPEVKDFFEQYPYTSTSKIKQVIRSHDHLKIGKIAQFLADMPKEAVDVMKEYNTYTGKVCGKQAVFYIIADKKDFKKSDSRRDPILVAQSPFGHFWQILGAWDKEMMFLEEL